MDYGGNARGARELLERHPVAPFVSLHHADGLFPPAVGLPNRTLFFEALWRNPIGFAQQTVAVVPERPERPGGPTWIAAVSTGLSVRLFRSGTAAGEALLWDQTATEGVIPLAAGDLRAEHKAEIR